MTASSQLSTFAANIIWLLHLLFVLWVLITPFTNSEPMLILHLIMMPFLWMHWWINDDTCSLTMIEMKLRGLEYGTEDAQKSFFYNLVSPVYRIQDGDVRSVAWLLSLLLWLITLTKVVKKPTMIKDVFGDAFAMWKHVTAKEPTVQSSTKSTTELPV
jgi:hypothetical protein